LTVEGVEFVEIGPGCFLMGSEKNAEGGDLLGRWCARLGLPWGDQAKPSSEMPVHWVEFLQGFWISRTEVSNEQYEAFSPNRQRNEYMPGDRHAAVDVSWQEARKFCVWFSEQAGKAVRLPSEAEWECACRAGSRAEFCFGNDARRLAEYGWCNSNWGTRPHEVGTRRPNAWGLHDFHGNVWEWCEDRYHESYESAPRDGTAWTEGGESDRVFRGGSFFNGAESCRSANRARNAPTTTVLRIGLRLAFRPSED